MYRQEIEKTLADGRKIVCFTSNGNSKSKSGAKIVLLEPGTERAGTFNQQTGIVFWTETTCYRGNVGWSAKKEREFLEG